MCFALGAWDLSSTKSKTMDDATRPSIGEEGDSVRGDVQVSLVSQPTGPEMILEEAIGGYARGGMRHVAVACAVGGGIRHVQCAVVGHVPLRYDPLRRSSCASLVID